MTDNCEFLMETKQAFFDVLLSVGTSFRISKVMIGVTFISFRCLMCMDDDILVE